VKATFTFKPNRSPVEMSNSANSFAFSLSGIKAPLPILRSIIRCFAPSAIFLLNILAVIKPGLSTVAVTSRKA